MWTRSNLSDHRFGPLGANFFMPQEARFNQLGGQVLMEYRANKLIKEGGRVVGASGVTAGGSPFTIRASQGVVLATGGFSSNVEMRQYYNVHWADLGPHIPTSNRPSSLGDGIVMAREVGANLIDMEWIQVTSGGGLSVTIDNIINVNSLGQRFLNEDNRRDRVSEAILRQPGAVFWIISDGHLVDDILGGVGGGGAFGIPVGFPIRDAADNVRSFIADTVEDLAIQLGMDPRVLRASVDQFNAAYAGTPDPLGRQIFHHPLNKPPFHAFRGVSVIHHTMGGIEINERAQALDTNGRVIPGLYAAGEVTGGIHGANRLGGNAITDVIVFGRIAGQSIAEDARRR